MLQECRTSLELLLKKDEQEYKRDSGSAAVVADSVEDSALNLQLTRLRGHQDRLEGKEAAALVCIHDPTFSGAKHSCGGYGWLLFRFF